MDHFIYDYFVVRIINDVSSLEKTVSDMMNDGYELAGNLIIEYDESATIFYQPMIKRIKDTTKW